MIDLSDIVNDPDFAQAYTVTRTSGSFGQGGYIPGSPTQIAFWGIIQPASEEDLQQIPEADRTLGMMSFISTDQMYKTRVNSDGSSGLSDTIVWNGQTYKIVGTWPWKDFGFWKAVGSRQSTT